MGNLDVLEWGAESWLSFCEGQILQLQQGTLLSFHTKNEAQMNVLAVKKHRKDNTTYMSVQLFQVHV